MAQPPSDVEEDAGNGAWRDDVAPLSPEVVARCAVGLELMRAWRDAEDLPPEERAARHCSDGTLARYLLARKGDVAAAKTMLLHTLEWQRTSPMMKEPWGCDMCEKEAGCHAFYALGPCADSSVGCYGCPARASSTEVSATVRHVMAHLAAAYQAAETPEPDGSPALAAPGAAKWTWLVDFNGFGLTHALQAKLGISFASLFSSHHPERLGRLVLINPPWVWSVLLTACIPFTDARTLSKFISVHGTPEQVRAQLVEQGVYTEDSVGLAWLTQTLGMQPPELPPLPAEARRYIPMAADSLGWHGRFAE